MPIVISVSGTGDGTWSRPGEWALPLAEVSHALGRELTLMALIISCATEKTRGNKQAQKTRLKA
jgi:hypothetical protein